MTDAIALRRLTPADPMLLDRVAPDVFDDAIDPARLAAYLAEPGHMMIVALKGGEVVGQCAAVIHRHPDQPTELYIDNLGVTPSLHRRGIGRALVRAMFAWGKERGCEEAWVGTEVENAPARALYAAEGADEKACMFYEYDIDAVAMR